MHTVFALLCFVVVIHWLIFPYPSGLLHWHCGNLTIAPVPAKQPWWIWINTSCEFILNDSITTTKQSTTKPCAYFLGYTVYPCKPVVWNDPYLFICLIFDSQIVPAGYCYIWRYVLICTARRRRRCAGNWYQCIWCVQLIAIFQYCVSLEPFWFAKGNLITVWENRK